MLEGVLDRSTATTDIGRILMPGPTYLGAWARDTSIAVLGLNRLGKVDLAEELLERYWRFQITPASDPSTYIFRNKTFAGWTDAAAFQPTKQQLLREVGAFPTSVYIRTPDFPAGTHEIYANRADLDGAAWLVIALYDQYLHTRDERLLREFAAGVGTAISYLRSRDIDGDHLLEQGPNEDWADILLRHGKVSYSQAVWFRCLEAAQQIFQVLGQRERAEYCRREREAVGDAINRILMTRYGYFANYVSPDGASYRRALDTALLVAFGACNAHRGREVLTVLDSLRGPFGWAVVEPGYGPEAIGPSHYVPGQYQNEGIWPWINAYLALAWAKVGDHKRAEEVIYALFTTHRDTTFEWIDGLTGEHRHAEFATSAGALAWAIVEGGLTD